jgi:(p)ppGpp synthase/HD superfamily hydrolase
MTDGETAYRGVNDAVLEALRWMSEAFACKVRKGRSHAPYLSHLVSTAALVVADRGSSEALVAALLHDAIEDLDVSKGDIERRFGARTADIVVRVSDGLDKEGRKSGGRDGVTWKARKRAYLEHLREEVDESVLRVSLADKLDNARDLLVDVLVEGARALRYFNASPGEQLWWYSELADIYRERLPGSSLTPAFTAVVAQMEQLIDLEDATREWEREAACRKARRTEH